MRSPSRMASYEVVGDDDDRLADLGLEPEELGLQLLACDRVGGTERFVHEHHRRVSGQGTRDPTRCC